MKKTKDQMLTEFSKLIAKMEDEGVFDFSLMVDTIFRFEMERDSPTKGSISFLGLARVRGAAELLLDKYRHWFVESVGRQ